MFGIDRALARELKSRARDQARWLIRDHGDEAEAVIMAKLRRRGATREDLARYRLTRIELKKLRRRQSVGGGGTAVVVWRPRLLSLKGLRKIFGIQRD